MEISDCDSAYRSYYDPFGFFFSPSDTYYGSYYNFYGYTECFIEIDFVYLGTTGSTVRTPGPPCPNLSVNIRATSLGGQIISGTTQNALVGAVVPLEAEIGGGPSNGTFRWSFTGGGRQDLRNTFLPPNFYNVIWTAEGTHQAMVEFTPSGSNCRVTASFNVNITIPTLKSFTAQQVNSRLSCNEGCSTIQGTAFTLGCFPSVNGITFQATLQAPAEGYISSPLDSKFKFVQIFKTNNRFRRREATTFECVNHDWSLDGSDPYDIDDFAIKSFTNENRQEATIVTEDSPGQLLDGQAQGSTFQFDYTSVEQDFEMYVVYFVGSPVNSPVFRVLARLPWRWGGEVEYDPADTSCPQYRINYILDPPQQRAGFASVNQQTAYGPPVDPLLLLAPCGGEPDPDPTPDPTPDPCYYGYDYYNCY